MPGTYYHRPPSSATVRPLPQNRQAFGTISMRATPGMNSANPLQYQGGYGGVRPGISSLPQFGHSVAGAFSPMNPGPANPFAGGLRPTQQQQYDQAMELSRRRFLLNRPLFDNRVTP